MSKYLRPSLLDATGAGMPAGMGFDETGGAAKKSSGGK